VDKPKPSFLGKLAPEELQKQGNLFVFWTGIFWSPDSRDAIEFPDQTALDDYLQSHRV
jgi:hypothetical protein